jgi:hypothetical protein
VNKFLFLPPALPSPLLLLHGNEALNSGPRGC